MRKVSIIIPAYNAENFIGRCLDAVLKQNHEDYDVLVIDDASTDKTASIVKNYPVTCIRNEKNRGASFTRNLGAEKSSGEILVYVDSDTVIPPHAVASMVKNLEDRPKIKMVMAVYSDKTESLNVVSDYKNLDVRFRFSQLDQYLRYISSFCMAIRKKTYLDSGGFSTEFKRSSVEDVEFGYRVCDGERAVFQDRTVEVDHLKTYTLWGLLRSNFSRILNMRRIAENSGGKFKPGHDTPRAYMVNLALAPVLLSCALLTAAAFRRDMLYISLGLVFLFVVNNRKFLGCVYEKRGAFFAIKCFVLLYAEYIGAAAALASSLVLVPYRKEYS